MSTIDKPVMEGVIFRREKGKLPTLIARRICIEYVSVTPETGTPTQESITLHVSEAIFICLTLKTF